MRRWEKSGKRRQGQADEAGEMDGGLRDRASRATTDLLLNLDSF